MVDEKKKTEKTEKTTPEDTGFGDTLKAMDEARKVQSSRVRELLATKYGVTPEMIQDWKNKAGRIKVQAIQDNWFVFRGLSRLEWQEMSDTEAQIEANMPSEGLKKEMRTVNRCLLFPEQLDIGAPAQAGVASVLFAEVLKFSGFEPDMAEAVEL